jgi:Tol biopolymer transport system component
VLRRLSIASPLVALATTVLSAFGSVPAQAAFAGTNGRIAFTFQKWRLYACNPTPPFDPHACPEPVVERSQTKAVLPNGRGQVVLHALDRGLGGYPPLAWSPKARLVAFDTFERIGIVRRDGTGRRLLPRLTGTQDLDPTWSPDGRRLAFIGDRFCYGCVWLYTVRRDGTGVRRVIRQGAASPSWSVKNTLAFVNYNDSSRVPGDIPDGLYTVRPNGSRLRRVYSGGYLGPGVLPDWSPDGTMIAFLAATRDAPDNTEIFTVKANGRGPRRLTHFGSHRGGGVGAPKWSPDGRFITFVDNYDLYVMRSNGRGLHRIVDTPRRDPAATTWTTIERPAWLPSLTAVRGAPSSARR